MAVNGLWPRFYSGQGFTSDDGAVIFELSRSAARKLAGAHVSIQRATHANAGPRMSLVLAIEGVTTVEPIVWRYSESRYWSLAATLSVRPSRADCKAFSMRCLA